MKHIFIWLISYCDVYLNLKNLTLNLIGQIAITVKVKHIILILTYLSYVCKVYIRMYFVSVLLKLYTQTPASVKG